MAEYWVRATGGNDANDGLTFATARQTLTSIVAKMTSDVAVKGSILNVVNETDYAWPTTEIDFSTGAGTSFSDFGYLVRGVSDSAATPAFARIVASGGDAVRRVFRMNAGSGWNIYRNLLHDASAKTGDANVYTGVRYNSPSGPAWLDGCPLICAGTGVLHSGTRQILALQASAPDGSRIWDCYFQNPNGTIHGITGATASISQIGNVFYFDVAAAVSTFISRTLAAGTGDTFDFTYNTIYITTDNVVSAPIAYSVGGTDGGVVNVNSNLVFIESTSGAPDVEFLHDTSGGSVPWSGTVDNNVLLGGPSVASGDVPEGWYIGTFDGGVDPKVNDQVAYSQAEATIFNNPAATYAWDPLGNGATVTILKDLRPRLYQAAGLGGTVPGALPAASTDYSAAIATSNTAPETGESITVTATALNTGTSATSVLYSMPIPAGLTHVSHIASAGTYVPGTGVWTIGALASASPQTLAVTCTVAAAAGVVFAVTASWTSGDPATDTDSSNDSASINISVVIDQDVNPGDIPYLDTAPIYAPVLLAEINAILRTKRNRILQHEQRRDVEDRKWREYTSRRITLAPSTTAQVISSIERIDFLVMEATASVEVSTSDGSSDSYFPAASKLALLDGDFTTLKLRNPSGSASVDVLLVVID